MALELFKPFVIRRLIDRDLVKTVKSNKKLIERRTPETMPMSRSKGAVANLPASSDRAPSVMSQGKT